MGVQVDFFLLFQRGAKVCSIVARFWLVSNMDYVSFSGRGWPDFEMMSSYCFQGFLASAFDVAGIGTRL